MTYAEQKCDLRWQHLHTKCGMKLARTVELHAMGCQHLRPLCTSVSLFFPAAESMCVYSCARSPRIRCTRNATAPAFPQGTAPATVVLPGDLLSQLLQLSRMTLSGSASCAGLNHLSCLTDMQHLALNLHGSTQAEEFAGVVRLGHELLDEAVTDVIEIMALTCVHAPNCILCGVRMMQ